MKLREIFRFEFAYQVRRVWPWLMFGALAVFAFLFVRVNFIADAIYAESILNTPFLIAGATVIGGLVWLLVAAVVAGEAGARDVQARMHPLTYTVPVSKAAYLGGRFLAALALNAIVLLAVQVGILLAYHAPGIAPEVVGPFRPAAYLTAYAFIALPNAFVATAIQFSFAVRSGRPMASYAGSLLLVFMGFFVAGILLWGQAPGTLLDPIGVRFIVEDLAHVWTPAEKVTRLIALEGAVLANRLLWAGVALGTLAVTFLRFRFAHRTEGTWWRRIARRQDAHAPAQGGSRPAGAVVSAPVSVPPVPRTFGAAVHVRQTRALASDAFRSIATSRAGLALLVLIPLLTVPVVADQMVSDLAPLVPTTERVLAELTASLSDELSRWVIVPLLLVFFAGELVWRERDAGLGEMVDAMPTSEWAPLLGKFLGLALVLAAFTALLAGAGMLAQALMGYRDFEVGLYLKVMLGLQLTEYLLFALLALVVHAVVDQKYVGHLVAIGAYVFVVLSSMFGIEHDLLVYGASPGWSYTEMRGFGPSLGPWLWFKLYWAAWALLLAVVARLLWGRGRDRRPGGRLQWARSRFTRPTAWTAAAAVGLILALGGFIFYNTNVRNEYLSAADEKERRAAYERRYGRYADLPQPRLAGARLRVEIYPERRSVHIRGTYRLVNRSAVAIDSIHVATGPGVATGALAGGPGGPMLADRTPRRAGEDPGPRIALGFGRPATRVVADVDLGYSIYALAQPLLPGDSLRLDFEVHVEPRGFRESGVDASVVANGTSFTNEWLPAIGYQGSRELVVANDRREHGLAPRPLIPSLYDAEARNERGPGIAFEAVVGTDADQVAVAPGALRRTWIEGGRRYFHYSTDSAIGSEWGFFSADYAVHEAQWTDPGGTGQVVAIRIFHQPGHRAHLDRMLQGIRASLDYYTGQFGPYPYRHISFVEAPGTGVGMHAEAGMITYSEGFTQLKPQGDLQGHDHPFAVVAHEMAHQWTVPYANVEGAPVMSESIAWYYAMQAVEHARGSGELRRLLRFMRGSRRPIRLGVPLLRGLDPYMSYRRGPFALYTLSEYVGEERVHRALRRLLETHEPDDAPLATTLDLYRELQAETPDSLRYLLHDLFEVNTVWNLTAERATAEQTREGTWQVTLDVRARKAVTDSAGVETEIPMDEWVQVGVFGPAGDDGDALGRPLYERMHRIRSGRQTITVTVPRRPALAGIDPYRLLDWEESGGDDNAGSVTVGE